MKTEIKLPSKSQVDLILDRSNVKYKLLILLMMDAGLRVSEAVQLQIKHIDLQRKELSIRSLKKRKKESYRTIPMTSRILNALADYWPKLKDRTPEAYLFPSGKGAAQPHLDRKTVWKRIKKYSGKSVHPHMLRHFFGTNLKDHGVDIDTAKELLGHASRNTTEIYWHVKHEEKKRAIEAIDVKPTLLARVNHALFGRRRRWREAAPRAIQITPMQHGLTKFHVGRQKELETLHDLSDKQVNTLILGPQGIGKSHLLDNYNHARVIRVDDLRQPRRVLAGMLLELFQGEKEEILKMLTRIGSEDEFVNKVANRESLKRLTDLAIDVTQPKEYTIVIDDLTDLTKMGVRILEKLKNHFHIIAAARKLKVEFRTCFTNFQRLEIKPLSRIETIEMIDRLSTELLPRIDDYESYKNRIWEDTQGVPLYVIEMIDRLAREPRISPEVTDQVKHAASKQEIDFSVPLLIAFSSLIALRYLGPELGDQSGPFRFIAGIALVVAIFSRSIFRTLKRKFL